MTIYGANLSSDHRQSPRFKSFKRGEVKAWWCCACRIAVVQMSDPIECELCGGDMTIAPHSVREKMDV